MARDLPDRRLPLGVSHAATYWTFRSGLPHGRHEPWRPEVRRALILEPRAFNTIYASTRKSVRQGIIFSPEVRLDKRFADAIDTPVYSRASRSKRPGDLGWAVFLQEPSHLAVSPFQRSEHTVYIQPQIHGQGQTQWLRSRPLADARALCGPSAAQGGRDSIGRYPFDEGSKRGSRLVVAIQRC
jgi:hypothetical protein